MKLKADRKKKQTKKAAAKKVNAGATQSQAPASKKSTTKTY